MCMKAGLLGLAIACYLIGRVVSAKTPFAVNTEFTVVEHWTRIPSVNGVRFAKDNRVFVMTKGGFIYSAKNIDEPKLTRVADLSKEVFNNFDRGMTGLAPHPDFPEKPYVYVLYGRDGTVNDESVGRWGDICPNNLCEGSGALGRLKWDAEQNALINYKDIIIDWCTNSETHQVGDLRFDSKKNLIMSAGDHTFYKDGVNFGSAPNTCKTSEPVDLESDGILRSQNEKSLVGKVLYMSIGDLEDFETKNLKVNDLKPKLNIHARGFRNPYRFVIDSFTDEIYLADVGNADWEELNKIAPAGSVKNDSNIPNYGWPCYQGPAQDAELKDKKKKRCDALYNDKTMTLHTLPLWYYSHTASFGDVSTPAGGQSALTGVGFYIQDKLPAQFKNALFFTDYTRDGIWAMLRKPDGALNTADEGIKKIIADIEGIVDVTPGPDGHIYLSQVYQDKIWRLMYVGHSGTPPRIRLKMDKTYGALGLLGLLVELDATGTKVAGDINAELTYEWDFLGNGKFVKWLAKTWYRYNTRGVYNGVLRVITNTGAKAEQKFKIFAGYDLRGNIQLSVKNYTFGVNDVMKFSANILDENKKDVPAELYAWKVLIAHCYPGPKCLPHVKSCHQHMMDPVPPVKSYEMVAKDHDYPSFYTFVLDVEHPEQRDLKITKIVTAMPDVIAAVVNTDPPGFGLVLASLPIKTPYMHNNLYKGKVSLSVQSEQMTPNRQAYRFKQWNHGGDAAKNTAIDLILTSNQTKILATFELYDIPVLPEAQGPNAPQSVSSSSGWRKCTVTWQQSQAKDANNPVVNYIVYYRQLKFMSPVEAPQFSAALTPSTSTTWDFEDVDVGAMCQFQVSAVTKMGEGGKSSISDTRSLLVTPPSMRDCPEKNTCTFRSALLDDFNHQPSPKNYMNEYQEAGDEFTKDDNSRIFTIKNDKLHFRSKVEKPSDVYWYSMLTNPNVKCLPVDVYFTHLYFKVTASAGTDFEFGMHSKDATCTDYVDKITVKLSEYAHMDGTEKEIWVPVEKLTSSTRGVVSVFFRNFNNAEEIVYDDLALINDCSHRRRSSATLARNIITLSTLGAGAFVAGCAYLAI